MLSRTKNIIRLGAHVNVAGKKMTEIFDLLIKYKANCFQFLTGDLAKNQDLKEIRKLSEKYNISPVIHCAYGLNLAHDYTTESWWIKDLIKDLTIAHKINAIGCVLHLGKYLDLPRNLAVNNSRLALIYVLKKTANLKSKIIIETPAGSGTEMFYKITTLASLINSIPKKYQQRLGVCIDTCHIFSAGYEIRNKDAIKEYLERFDKKIGLNKIALLHLNDSKTEKKSHLDRHEKLGSGSIGLTGLLFFAKNMMKHNVPIILETPSSSYKTELQILWKQALKI